MSLQFFETNLAVNSFYLLTPAASFGTPCSTKLTLNLEDDNEWLIVAVPYAGAFFASNFSVTYGTVVAANAAAATSASALTAATPWYFDKPTGLLWLLLTLTTTLCRSSVSRVCMPR